MWFLLGRGSGRRSAYRKRRPSGCGMVLWALVGVCAAVALAELHPLIFGPLLGLLGLLIVLGLLGQHRAKRVPVEGNGGHPSQESWSRPRRYRERRPH